MRFLLKLLCITSESQMTTLNVLRTPGKNIAGIMKYQNELHKIFAFNNLITSITKVN